jgi:hypothetical protein
MRVDEGDKRKVAEGREKKIAQINCDTLHNETKGRGRGRPCERGLIAKAPRFIFSFIILSFRFSFAQKKICFFFFTNTREKIL